MEKKKEEDLQKIDWLLEKEDNQKKKDQQPYIPSYGDVTELNTERTILDLVGKDTLEALCADTMDLLDTSVAVYEKNGDYAFGMFVSGWCQLMDAASRKLCNTEDNQKALASGKWHCHENCWNESAKVAIKTGKPTDIACIGGINLYAEPIYSGNQIIGVINIGYGNPPTDEKSLKELSQKYQIDYHTLLTRAKEYKPRPPFIIDIAKKRLHNIAFLIGKIVQNARNEQKLKESEKQFKTITEGSADAIFITDQKGNYIYVNQAVSALLGYSRKEITSMNIRDISSPEEARANVRDFQRLLQGEKLFKELSLIKKDGSSVPVDLHAILLPNGFVYGSCRDITQRKEVEEKITQLHSLVESIRNVNQLIVQEHDFGKVIQESCRILLQTRKYLNIEIALLDEESGRIKPVAKEGVRKLKDWAVEVDNPGDVPRCIQEVVQTRKPTIVNASRDYCGKCPYFMTDLPYKNIFVPMLLKGRLVGIITTTIKVEHEVIPDEIELLKEVAADLAFARNSFLDEEKKLSDYYLLQIAGKTAKFGGWSVDTATRTYLWSDTVADIHEMPHGYAPHVKEGIKFYAPEWQERITKVFSDCAHQGNPYNEEMEIITGKGKRKWVRTTGRAVKNKKGEIVKVVGSFQDITKHKKTEQELRERETLLTAVMDNLPIGIAINTVFPSVKFVYMNDKFVQIYQTTRKALSKLGAFWNVIYEDPTFRSQIKKRVENDIANGDPKRMHWENIPLTRKGKETRYISAYNIPIPGKDLFISTVTDVTDINRSQEKLRKTMNAIIETISKISETRDPYTAGHQYRVHQLSVAIARELGLLREKIEAVRIAALIHDIGKIAIPSEILTKPSKLSEIEFSLIKSHPQTGFDILKDINFPYPIAQIVLQHHERINGSGYPNHLKGDKISLEAKIIGVADVVEAMSSHRPYREALGIDVALEEITQNKGILYDPEVVDVCIKLFREKGFKFE
ncbi:MAG: PAS domain S-box protein [Atribacterota bacterium]|nr:PAS domain S-box protein [Atribacterota bacterium]MDD3031616.1 PAS domain S-box protein [Atribacterota bacterium]